MLACENNKFECVQFLFRNYDNLDFHHKNNNGDDAINIMKNIIRSKNSEADGNSQEVNQRLLVNGNNDDLSKSDYLNRLLLLISEAFQKKISSNIKRGFNVSSNTRMTGKFGFNFP